MEDENHGNQQQTRPENGKDWWGTRHVEPDEGNPDRQHIYASNPPITKDQVQESLKAYNKSIEDPEKGNRDSQAPHLRPSTPPMKRVERQLQGLKDQGVEVSEGLEKEVTDKYTINNGTIAALTEWCQNEENVPVEYANQLLDMIDRLKLKMAAQQRDLQHELSQRKKINDNIMRDLSRYKAFHYKVFDKQEKHAKTWIKVQRVYDHMPQQETRATPELRTLIDEAAKDWRELNTIYNTEWPTIVEAQEAGKYDNGTGLLELFDQRQKESEDMKDRLKEIRDSLAQKTEEIEKKDREIQNLRESNDKLKLDPHETFGMTSTPSSGANHRKSSITSVALSTSSSQMEEIKRLRDENSSLQKELDLKKSSSTDTDNERTSDSTDSSLDGGFELEVTRKEVGELQSQVKKQAREIDQLNETLINKEKELKEEATHFRQEANIHRNRLKALEAVNYKTADSLALAIGNKNSVSYNESHMSLRDRINYLNLLCFLRTRNYILLALRERSNRLANVLLDDAQRWAKFCHEDFATMDPNINIQIKASLHILYGVRTMMTTKTNEGMEKARGYVQLGRQTLQQHPKEFLSCQPLELAAFMMNLTEAEQETGEYKKWPRFSSSKRKLGSSTQREINDSSILKADALQYAGFHDPLSPSKWDQKNIDEDLSGFDV
ncbi:hypothetical protein FLONG3_2725 [Fusarium longipes]|uniref:Uncharacterized protein n=1 Tax=Fusarium longipes TaxID=694270 RepID=A0A395T338_9HYPO|nr:hypothetical protein FLONG3_2725 [Fusarium longipes]